MPKHTKKDKENLSPSEESFKLAQELEERQKRFAKIFQKKNKKDNSHTPTGGLF